MPQLIGGPGTDAEMVARIHSVIEFNPLERLKLAKILPRETLSTDYAPDPYTAADLEAALTCMKASSATPSSSGPSWACAPAS